MASIFIKTYLPVITSSKELYENLYHRILPVVQSAGECRAIVLRIIENFYHYDALAVAVNKKLPSSLSSHVLEDVIERLYQQEPIQYILQKSYFLNRSFKVTPAVLIPRQETEELVIRILREHTLPNLQILDIATGSGCIAITLQKELNFGCIDALDISEEALQIARENAAHHDAMINWYQIDILRDPLPDKKWDIIVSNPPYVCMSEMKDMLPQVLAYEPSQALFVPDFAPLKFYKKIIAQASIYLKPSGKLYLEINERFGKEVMALCHQHSFGEVYLEKDLNDKDRFIIATRTGLSKNS
jgi:release factor glutamine methyltransferase